MAEPLPGGGLGFSRFCGRHGFARSSLPKGPRDLIPKWFEQVFERGALVGLNESLDWHTWNEAHFLQCATSAGGNAMRPV